MAYLQEITYSESNGHVTVTDNVTIVTRYIWAF